MTWWALVMRSMGSDSLCYEPRVGLLVPSEVVTPQELAWVVRRDAPDVGARASVVGVDVQVLMRGDRGERLAAEHELQLKERVGFVGVQPQHRRVVTEETVGDGVSARDVVDDPVIHVVKRVDRRVHRRRPNADVLEKVEVIGLSIPSTEAAPVNQVCESADIVNVLSAKLAIRDNLLGRACGRRDLDMDLSRRRPQTARVGQCL